MNRNPLHDKSNSVTAGIVTASGGGGGGSGISLANKKGGASSGSDDDTSTPVANDGAIYGHDGVSGVPGDDFGSSADKDTGKFLVLINSLFSSMFLDDVLYEILTEVRANSDLKNKVCDLEQKVLELQEGSGRKGRQKVLPSRKVRVCM